MTDGQTDRHRETDSGTDCCFSCYLRPLAGSAHTWSASWHTETDTKPSSAKSQRAKSKKPLANCPSGLFNSGSYDCNSKLNWLQRRSCNCSCHLFAILFSPLKVNLSCSFSCGFVFRTLCALIVFKVRPAAAGAAYPRVGQTWIYHPQQWTNNCATVAGKSQRTTAPPKLRELGTSENSLSSSSTLATLLLSPKQAPK